LLELSTTSPLVFDSAWYNKLSPDESARIRELAHIERISTEVILRARSWRAGFAVVGERIFNSSQGFSPRFLLQMLLYASGTNLDKFIENPSAPTSADQVSRPELRVLLAALLTRSAEEIMHRHISQEYLRTEGLQTTIRGTVRWIPRSGPPALGLRCTYFVKTTDNLPNAVVTAGLNRARTFLDDSSRIGRTCQSQCFSWNQIAQSRAITRHDVTKALDGLTRMTEHYRTAIQIAGYLLFGNGPESLNGAGDAGLQGLWFDLPILFERILARLVREFLGTSTSRVRSQDVVVGAVRDGLGSKYLSPRPDLVLYKGSVPVAIIDAKFKPGYVDSVGRSKVARKVDEGDLYQMFFYANRIQLRHSLPAPVPTYIVAPQLVGTSSPSSAMLNLTWSDETTSVPSLVVLPLNLEEVLGRIEKHADSHRALTECAPELASVLLGLSSSKS
jgi:5-methylcytosine-specific restriction endonuclease McrBC regulatory subunit McrC